MAISVSDIEQKEFAYKGAGYDPYDVDQYLDQICDEMVAQQDRITALEAQLAQAQRELQTAQNAVQPAPQAQAKTTEDPAPIRKTSEVLENILVSAQRLSDEALENARKQADEIINKAKDQAESIVGDAKEEKTTLEKEVEALRGTASDYKTRFLNLINEQKKLLEGDALPFGDDQEAK